MVRVYKPAGNPIDDQIKIMKKFKFLSYILLVNLLIFVILVLCLELFYPKHQVWGKHKWDYSSPLAKSKKKVLGYGGAPFDTIQAQRYFNEELIYDVTYNLNSYGWRKVPNPEHRDFKHFLLLLGGSNVFGEGVKEDQTFAFQLQKKSNLFQPYIYAFPGYGPQHILRLLEAYPYAQEIGPKTGIGLYFYYPFHKERLIGTDKFYRWSKAPSPYYRVVDKKIKFLGMDTEVIPIKRFLLRIWGRSTLGRKFNLHFPSIESPESNTLLCMTFEEMRRVFKRNHPRSRFYIVLAPFLRTNYQELISSCLEPNEIPYLDLNAGLRSDYSQLVIKPGIDEHLSIQGHEWLSAILEKRLNAIKPD